ncbi:MAG TPA: hypothetical protein VES88_07865 [Gemmatimonadaceae bacterium]|nr:hypothetical protein [Gemmatimonadaceae bacterium]
MRRIRWNRLEHSKYAPGCDIDDTRAEEKRVVRLKVVAGHREVRPVVPRELERAGGVPEVLLPSR